MIINPYAFASGPPAPTDPLFSSVVSLVPFNDANGSTSPDDLITPTWSTVGGISFVTTSQQKYGTGALQVLNGGAGNGALTANASIWNLAGDFCIEVWVKLNSLTGPGGGAQFIVRKGSGFSPYVIYTTGGQIQMLASNNGTSWAVAPIGGSVSTGVWYHLEFDRSGNNFYAFLGGTQIGSTATMSGALTTNSGNMVLGAEDNAAANNNFALNGYIGGLRVTSGAARNTSNFTPPTAAWPTS